MCSSDLWIGDAVSGTCRPIDGIRLVDLIATPHQWRRDGRRLLVVAVPVGQAAKLRSELARPDPLVAPLVKGQSVARMKIYVGEQLLAEKPLLALQTVDESGVIGRAWDAVRLWIK